VPSTPRLSRRSGLSRRRPLPLAASVIALEQYQHEGLPRTGPFLVPQAIHWLSDSLLAYVLATAAVYGACLLAPRLGVARRGLAGAVGLTAVISLLFAAALVPGAAMHEGLHRLEIGIPKTAHMHAAVAGMSTSAHERPPLAGSTLHVVSDALVGQLVGFPVTTLMLLATAYRPRLPRSPWFQARH
jgi:hypothetical protein